VSDRYAARTFIPSLRAGFAASIGEADTLGAGVPGRVGLPIELWVNDPAGSQAANRIAAPVRFHGPGEVTGIDPRVIVRTEPAPFTADFEPNYLPLVEFDPPDFAWRFTPARADASGRLRPWLVLVVVRADRVSRDVDAALPLPRLDVPVGELPDLADSWAWAHAQVTHVAGVATAADDALRSLPDRTVSRLIAPRRLEPGETYLACLVPAFAAGVKAGLGRPLTADDERQLAPAWTSGGSGRVLLPIYYEWEFTTGAGGDFEALARRLVPRALPPGVGAVQVDVGLPGWGMPPRPGGSETIAFEGALRRPEAPAGGSWAGAKAFADALRPALEQGVRGDVTPPLYGQGPAAAAAVPADGVPPHWLRELNLDPRHRIAAGLGAQVVRHEQERLTASAWEQLAAHERAQRDARQAQLADEVGGALLDKHFAAMDPSRLLQVAAPGLGVDTIGGAQADPAYRRLVRSEGPLGGEPTGMSDEVAAAGADAARARLAPEAPTEVERFAPTFPQPMYEALRDRFEGMLLPGADQVPANTIALLETNEPFIEAFLVGLNHELTRELVWRGYPVDLRGTSFRRFWEGGGGELAPIAGWAPASKLGEHRGADAGGLLVLLVRGDLLRRYPRAVVYAVEAVWSPDGKRREPGPPERELYPLFRARAGADVTFLGFGLTEAKARGSADPARHPGWFFVLQEQPTEPRFGFDEGDGARPPETVPTWDALSWEDVAVAPGAHLRLAAVAAKNPKRVRPGADGPEAAWGRNSAHMALIAQQAPMRVAVHASVWLPPEVGA
jgi:hypothetical protein